MASKEKKWKLLLKTIAPHLTSTDINSIIFLQGIPDGIAAKLDRDGLQFLKALNQMGYIKQDNPGLLEEILNDIPRKDLIPLLQKYTQEEEKISNINVPVTNPASYRLEKPSDFKSIPGQKKKKLPFEMERIPRGLCIIISNENFEDVQEDTQEDGRVEKADLEGGKKSPVENTCASPSPENAILLSTMTTEAGSSGTSLNKPSDDPKESKKRKGTGYDEKLLADTFKWLHFDVRVHRDLKGSEMKATLEEIANLDHSQYDAFVCCILSHGNEDGVDGTDWVLLSFHEIRRLFSGNRCRDLHSKPKLFIIQACRGKDIDHGVMKTGHYGTWKTSQTEPKHGERTIFLDADLAGTAASNEASKNIAEHKGSAVTNPASYRLEKPSDFKSIPGQKKKKPPFKMERIPRGLCIIISNENFEDVQEDTQEDGRVEKADLEGGKKSPVENTCASPSPENAILLSTMTTEAGSSGTSLNKPSDDPKESKKRKGTGYDEKLLADTFKWLHFDVRVHRDLKGSEMKATLEEIANLDHSQYDAFVCCILSHGNEDGVDGTDWVLLSFHEIRRLFSGNRCRDLHSKPKLFIIQACRGKDIDHGVMKTGHYGTWKTSQTEPKHGERTIFLDADLAGTAASNEASKNIAEHKGSADRKSSKTAPEDLNFVFAMSSVKGKAAVSSISGSWFIKHLCEKLQENAGTKHFMDITDDITEAMSEEVAHDDDFGRATASADFSHNLQRKVFFNPSRPWKKFYEEEYGKGKSSP
ncbi:caspase-8-like isoform X1 [Rhopilema esculentum]|uniref:caspase-8-like isoform X1 n=1 Tax=Rhopilema esculentum TaxID=499914 RepID=UPI0031DAB89B